ncbi:unnamed protein product [Moneuplotes crassus]|uniref:Uncharacterized protein n=1 Tax=Euplotes crassus TaxID=5936 RepID=A0AAD1XPW2_EUPCR|nr:unnamed protein product [Moneuplotes crassus]
MDYFLDEEDEDIFLEEMDFLLATYLNIPSEGYDEFQDVPRGPIGLEYDDQFSCPRLKKIAFTPENHRFSINVKVSKRNKKRELLNFLKNYGHLELTNLCIRSTSGSIPLPIGPMLPSVMKMLPRVTSQCKLYMLDLKSKQIAHILYTLSTSIATEIELNRCKIEPVKSVVLPRTPSLVHFLTIMKCMKTSGSGDDRTNQRCVCKDMLSPNHQPCASNLSYVSLYDPEIISILELMSLWGVTRTIENVTIGFYGTDVEFTSIRKIKKDLGYKKSFFRLINYSEKESRSQQ